MNTYEEEIDYKFVFKVFGDDFDANMISKKLNFDNYTIKNKGEKIAGFVEVPHDMVLFEKKYSDFALGVKDFIMRLYDRREDIKEIKNVTGINLYLCCYICSEMGQIGFTISTDVMKWLSELNLALNIDILSFGMVEAD